MPSARAFREIPEKELRTKKKEDLLKLILDARSADEETNPKKVDDGTSIWDTNSTLDHMKTMIEPLLNRFTEHLQKQIAELKSEISSLRLKFHDPQMHLDAEVPEPNDDSDGDWTLTQTRRKRPKTFATVVQQSVKAALQEDRCKNDVVISGANEGNDDQKMVTDLCQKMQFASKPAEIKRLGKKDANNTRPRLLKVSFASSFDARAFMSRYGQTRRTDSEMPRLKLRSGKSQDEWQTYKKNATLAYKLNQEARDKGEDISFSTRDNGEIWKFAKNESGAWRRVTDWVPEAGNH